MSDIAIHCDHLSKQYRIGERESYKALRDVITDAAVAPFRSLRAAIDRRPRTGDGNGGGPSSAGRPSSVSDQPSAADSEIRNPQSAIRNSFWALDDVSFEVKRGEVVGIIGRNGAGKSTLLKILSRITKPTRGRAEIHGRVGSLLEVGTGFHPELTGRENIYLNAAILGMRKTEVAKNFDEIVAFAEVEKFIDTPVKRYSSGMYVRLAFAVAAHLEPEILVIDEVLAVGDAAFQKKCLGKIGEVAQGGRTVLFVSHNMHAVRSLCDQGIWLEEGIVSCKADVYTCTKRYESVVSPSGGNSWRAKEISLHKKLLISGVSVELLREQPNRLLQVHVDLLSKAPHKPAFLAIDILDSVGHPIMQALPNLEGFIDSGSIDPSLDVTIHLPPLIPSRYSLTVWVGSHNTETLDEVKGCVDFEITDSPTAGRTFPHSPDHGFIVPAATLNYRNGLMVNNDS